MGIQIKRVGHVGILVSDFERSFEFYTEGAGVQGDFPPPPARWGRDGLPAV